MFGVDFFAEINCRLSVVRNFICSRHIGIARRFIFTARQSARQTDNSRDACEFNKSSAREFHVQRPPKILQRDYKIFARIQASRYKNFSQTASRRALTERGKKV